MKECAKLIDAVLFFHIEKAGLLSAHLQWVKQLFGDGWNLCCLEAGKTYCSTTWLFQASFLANLLLSSSLPSSLFPSLFRSPQPYLCFERLHEKCVFCGTTVSSSAVGSSYPQKLLRACCLQAALSWFILQRRLAASFSAAGWLQELTVAVWQYKVVCVLGRLSPVKVSVRLQWNLGPKTGQTNWQKK